MASFDSLKDKLDKASRLMSQMLSGADAPSYLAAVQKHKQDQQAQQQQYGNLSAFAPKLQPPEPPETPSNTSMLGQMIQQLQAGQKQLPIQDLISSQSASIMGDLIAGSVERALSKLAKLELSIKAAKGDPTAVTQVALNREKQQKDRASTWDQMKQNMVQPFLRQPMGGTFEGATGKSSKWIKDFGQGMEKLGGPVTGTLGMVLKGLGAFGGVVSSVAAFGKEMYNEQRGQNQGYARFSGDMAQVMAEKGVRDIQLAQMYGDALAPGAKRMEEAVSRLELKLAPAGIAISEIKMSIVETLADAASGFVDGIATIDFDALVANMAQAGVAGNWNPIIQQMQQLFGGGGVANPIVAPNIAMQTWMSGVGNNQWSSVYGTPSDDFLIQPGAVLPSIPIIGAQPN